MTTPTPFDDLAARMAEIRARVAAATPGPWQEFCESGDWWVEQTDGAYNGTGRTVGESPEWEQADLDLAMAAPSDIAYLLDALAHVAAQRDAARAELAAAQVEAAGLRAALEGVMDGIDDYWCTVFPEHMKAAQTALATPSPNAALLRDAARATALRAAIDAAGPLLLRGAYQEALSVLTRAAADDGRALGEYDGMGHGEVAGRGASFETHSIFDRNPIDTR